MEIYENASFYNNTAMDPKYYSCQRHLQLELALAECIDLLRATQDFRYERLDKMEADLQIPRVQHEEPEVTKPKTLARRFTQVGGRITVNATTSDAS